jgi:hypothetical protein
MADDYAKLPNELVTALNGVHYAYRDTGGGDGGVPLVLFQHFRRNLSSPPTSGLFLTGAS